MQQMIINMQQKPVTYIYIQMGIIKKMSKFVSKQGVKRIILGINKH